MKNLGNIQYDKDLITLEFLTNEINNIDIYAGEQDDGILCNHPDPLTFEIPMASNTTFGLVKGNNAADGVLIDETGTLVVHSINIEKIYQPDDNELIIRCGNASGSQVEGDLNG